MIMPVGFHLFFTFPVFLKNPCIFIFKKRKTCLATFFFLNIPSGFYDDSGNYIYYDYGNGKTWYDIAETGGQLSSTATAVSTPNLSKKEQSRQKRRAQIIEEIVKTEKVYVESLTVIVEVCFYFQFKIGNEF